MPLSNKLPTSLRYLKARLRILKRPMVWGSGAALLLAIGLFSQYWHHPEWFSVQEEDENLQRTGVASYDNLSNLEEYGTLPSEEDSAIGVDIDSLPVLLNDLGFNNPSEAEEGAEAGSNRAERATNETESDSTAVIPLSQPVSSAPSNRRNPFAATPQETRLFDLNLPGISRGNTSPTATTTAAGAELDSGLALGLNFRNPQTPVLSNQLQSALQQNSAQTPNASEDQLQRSPNSTNSSPTQGNAASAPLGTSQTPNQLAPDGRLQPGQPIPPGLLPATPLPTSPPAGTTGYTLPPLLNVPSSAPSRNPYASSSQYQQPLTGVPPVPQTVPSLPQTPNLGRSPTQTVNPGVTQGVITNPYSAPANLNGNSNGQTPYNAVPEAAPFSAPRSIGGGRINTFSNP